MKNSLQSFYQQLVETLRVLLAKLNITLLSMERSTIKRIKLWSSPLLYLLIALLAFNQTSFAQTELQLQILDRDMNPIAAKVIIINAYTNDTISLDSTNSTGNYTTVIESDSIIISTNSECFLPHIDGLSIPAGTQSLTRTIEMSRATDCGMNMMVVINNVYFDQFSDSIIEYEQNTIDLLSNILADHSNIVIELGGHCDSVEARKKEDWGLIRATKVKEALLEHGSLPKQLEVKNYKNEQPASNKPDENRRVEFKFIRVE